MPNEVKPTTGSVSTPSSKPGQQAVGGSSVQPQPVGVPNSAPGRVEPKDDVKHAGARKARDENKPLEVAVEQKTS
jgi:hypothetical protein